MNAAPLARAVVVMFATLSILSTGAVDAHESPSPLDVLRPMPAVRAPVADGAHGTVAHFPGASFAPVWKPASDAAEPYGVSFDCPNLSTSNAAGQTVVDDSFCPLYLLDPEDIMTQPVLVMDPQNPNLVAFNALHGGRGIALPTEAPPPSERARNNIVHQPHTTWQSFDGGIDWADNRYYAPEGLAREDRTVYGLDNTIALDGLGRAYVASLYAWRLTDGSEYTYALSLWDQDRLNRDFDYYGSFAIHDFDPGVRVESTHAVSIPETRSIAVLFLEDRTNATEGAVGPVINLVHTATGGGAKWDELSISQRIGPCRTMTAPLSWSGQIYVGCLPAQGYPLYPGAHPDYIQIHAIDTITWTSEHVAATSVSTPNAHLVPVGDTGHMYLVGAGLTNDGKARVQIAKGTGPDRWSDPEEFGTDFSELPDGSTLASARITAAAFKPESGYLHVIYLERYAVEDADTAGAQGRTMSKVYAVVRPDGAHNYQGKFDLRYGGVATRTQFSLAYQGGLSETVYEDLHDTLLVWRDPETGKDRMFTAFGDYGLVRFAEVVEHNALPAFPIPPLNVPAIPLTVPGTDPATMQAAAGVIFGAMMALLLAARKKKTVEAPHL